MTPLAALLLAVAGACALTDWYAVAAAPVHRRLEDLAKPATLLALLGVALALEPRDDGARWLLAAGLGLSLAGDVALLRGERSGRFAARLAAFLLAHLAYVAALARGFASPELALAGGLLVLAGVGLVGRRILAAVGRGPRPGLRGPVGAYLVAISAMVVAAAATASPAAMAGGLSFYLSDSFIGWDRFVGPLPRRGLLVMTTYHLGQTLLVLWLVR